MECCAQEITDIILQCVTEGKYYCVIFDETTDISHSSQLSLCLTYVYNNKRPEDFIRFVDVHEAVFEGVEPSFEPTVSGVTLGKLVLRVLNELHLDLSYCVGIGTDGCSMMLSEQLGAVAVIKKEAKNAKRCPCFNHALNLSMSETSSVQSIRNSVGVIKEVAGFFNASAKRNHVLLNVVHAQLKGLCETRWVERTESIIQFVDQLPKIVQALEYISDWKESSTSSKARSLVAAVRNVEFVLEMHCQLSVFILCLPLSRLFQKKMLDLSNAAEYVADLLCILKEKRTNAEAEFSNIFVQASESLQQLDVTIELPRLNNRQRNKGNIPSSTPEEYYRKTVYIPMLDCFISDVETRFSAEMLSSCTLTILLPKNVVKLDAKNLESTVNKLSCAYGDVICACAATDKSRLATEVESAVGQ
jgi:hypothetical protein